MVLNDIERKIVITKARRMTGEKSIEYLEKEYGIKISLSTYNRTYAHIRIETKTRLLEICKNMEERHMERIDELASISALLWKLLDNPKITVTETIRVLRELRELQPYISAYDESTAGVIEEVIDNFGKEDRKSEIVNISKLGRENQTETITTKTS